MLARCCDGDGLCFGDGTDAWCCDGEFYCSNNSESFAKNRGGILCPIDYSRFGAKATNLTGIAVAATLIIILLILVVVTANNKKYRRGHFDVYSEEYGMTVRNQDKRK